MRIRDPFELFDGFFTRGDSLMKTDVHETDDAAVFEIEIPGYKKEEINISIEDNNVLVVSAQTSSKKDEKSEHRVVWSERSSSCRRAFRLPQNTKTDDITAKYDNGILTVTVKKTQPELPEQKRILIE